MIYKRETQEQHEHWSSEKTNATYIESNSLITTATFQTWFRTLNELYRVSWARVLFLRFQLLNDHNQKPSKDAWKQH